MTPREFIDRFGWPKFRTVTIAFGGALLVPENMDRYIIGFNPTIATIQVRFGTTVATASGGIAVATNADKWFTHHEFGSIVNGPFIISAIGGAVTMMIAEGFMIDSENLNIERAQYALGKKTAIDQRASNGRVNNRSTRGSKPNGFDPIRSKRK